MSDDERTVELVRLTDAVEAEMLRDFIRDEGLFCATPGMNHRAVLGLAGGYVEIVVRVRASELEEAKELLEAFRGGELAPGEGFDGEGADDEDDEENEHDEDDEDDEHDDDDEGETGARPPTSPRLKRVAAFAALALTFGCGHFYARRYPQGFCLLAACALLLGGALFVQLSLFLLLYPVVMFADLAGSFVAVDRFNGVARSDAWAKVATGLPYAVLCLALAGPALFGAAPQVFLTDDAAAVCEANRQCEARPNRFCEHSMERAVVQGDYDREGTRACAECIGQARDDCAAVSRCHSVCGYWISRRERERPAPDDPWRHLGEILGR